jgi:hypothetical protein
MASPQKAIAQAGSAAATFSNTCSAAPCQNECISATPWLKSACTAGLHEIGNDTLPSFCGAMAGMSS